MIQAHAHAHLAADGSVELPEPLRRLAGWEPGLTLTLECDGDSILIQRLDSFEVDTPKD